MPSRPCIDLQSIADSHEEAFVIVDRDYCIRSVNVHFEREFGFDRRNIAGKRCYELSHLSTVPCHAKSELCPYHHTFVEGKPSVCQHIHYDAAGAPVKVVVRGYPLRSAGEELFLGMSVRRLPADEEEPRPIEAARKGAADHDLIASSAETKAAHEVLRETETALMAEVLRAHGGNRLHAARALGMSERTLYRKLKKYGIS